MSKDPKIIGKNFKNIISICQNALKGKTKLEETNLLSLLPTLRAEIQKGQFSFSSIKAFSLASHILDLKTRNLLGEFSHEDSKSENNLFNKLIDENSIESVLIHPIDSFKHYILADDIINAYFELLKIRKIRPNYSITEKEEICVQNKNEFKEVDSFERDKLNLLLKLNQLKNQTIYFASLQTEWEEAVTNLLYLVHLAQEGKVELEQKPPEGQILIRLKNLRW